MVNRSSIQIFSAYFVGSTQESYDFIASVLESQTSWFADVNPELIDTKSNLNADVIKDLCLICGFQGDYFEAQRIFIDITLLRKRNAIAHGQDEGVDLRKTLIENMVYTKAYLKT